MQPQHFSKNVTFIWFLLTFLSRVLLSEAFETDLSNQTQTSDQPLQTSFEDLALKSNFVLNFNYDEYIPSLETNSEFWRNSARKEILKRLVLPNTHLLRAKNIIFFIGDGMPLSGITAARIQKGQEHGKLGEETSLYLESFPNLALSKVSFYF